MIRFFSTALKQPSGLVRTAVPAALPAPQPLELATTTVSRRPKLRFEECGCGLGRDGRILCHARDERPQVRLALGPAVGTAIGEPSCLLGADHSVWCCTQSSRGPAGRPTRVAVDVPAMRIALSRHGLLVRRADGAVLLVPTAALGAPDASVATRTVAAASQRSLPGSDGCLVDADGRFDCPLEPATRRTAYRELKTGGVFGFHPGRAPGMCGVYGRSTTCRSDQPPSTWGALGDGLWVRGSGQPKSSGAGESSRSSPPRGSVHHAALNPEAQPVLERQRTLGRFMPPEVIVDT